MKFLRIYKDLRERIESGGYKPGDLLPRTEEIEKQYAVSRTAVKNALALLVRDRMVRRVPSKGTFVLAGGDPQQIGASRNTRIVLLGRGTLYGIIGDSFVARGILGLEDVFLKAGVSLHYLATFKTAIPDLLSLLKASEAGGVVLFAVYRPDLIKGIQALKLPAVCMDTIDQANPFPQYTSDHQTGGILAVRKLYALGHRKLIFFGNYSAGNKRNDPDHEYWAQAARAEASLLRMKGGRYVFLDAAHPKNVSLEMERTLKAHPDHTGIICASETHVRRLKDMLTKRAPEFPDSYDAVVFTQPREREHLQDRPVWQIRWNVREMGRLAAKQLLSIMKGEPYKPALQRMPVELF